MFLDPLNPNLTSIFLVNHHVFSGCQSATKTTSLPISISISDHNIMVCLPIGERWMISLQLLIWCTTWLRQKI